MRLILGLAVGIVMAIGSLQAMVCEPARAAGTQAVPPVRGATVWLNSSTPPADFRGKVVLVQFWTYTCVNWRRTLPYIRVWSEKYGGQGLTVIGVHTPEFEFEQNVDNVRAALDQMHIEYPVAVDNQHAIWDAFHNLYWPALYLIDAKGKIRFSQFGEGEYARTEREIQKLLVEAGAQPSTDLSNVSPQGAEFPADLKTLRSPETYVGFELGERFASKGGVIPNRRHQYTIPQRLALNDWALSGSWTIGKAAAVANDTDGQVVYRFHARDLNLVMAPAAATPPIRFRVLIDGQPPAAAHGTDVDEAGYGSVSGARMYQLIRQSGSITEREVVIQFLAPGVGIYDFTFG